MRWRLGGLAQALELLGMRVTPGLAAKGLAFLGIGLLAGDAGPLGRTHHLVARDLQQPAVHRVGDGLGLHGAVNDHTFEIGRAHSLDLDCAFDGGLEQLLQCSRPSSPSKRRKRPIWVASHGSHGS